MQIEHATQAWLCCSYPEYLQEGSFSPCHWKIVAISCFFAGRIAGISITENSEALAPLYPALMEALLDWRRKTEFSQNEAWIFASPTALEDIPIFKPRFERRFLLRHKEPRSHTCCEESQPKSSGTLSGHGWE